MLVYRASAALALRALVDALQRDRPLDDVLAELLAQVRGFLAADEAYVLLRQGEHLVVRAADGLPDSAVGRVLDLRGGIEGTAAALRETIAVADAATHRLFVDPYGRPAPPGAMVATPLLVRGRESGVLVAARRQPGRFDEAGIWWLELLAGLAAVVVAQDEAVRFQEQRARQAELLLTMAEIGADDPIALMHELAAVVRRGVEADRIDLLLHDANRHELVPLAPPEQVDAAGGASERPLRTADRGSERVSEGASKGRSRTTDRGTVRVPMPSEHPAARAFATGQPVLARDLPEGARVRVHSAAAIPIRMGSETRGVLYLASQRPAAFGTDDLPFLTLVAARVGVLLEREEIRRRRADTRAREDFVGVVSHELKTPIAVMQAYVELLRRRTERDGRPRDVEVLGNIADQTTRMLGMIEELLDVQRIEAGMLRLELGQVELSDLVRRIAAGLQLTTQEHRIVVDAPEAIELSADRRRIEEVVTNLIENAIKYSPAGGEIGVRIERTNDRARVAVADQGVGIAPEEQAHVFERFYRAAGAGERLHQGHHGLGLGLYIARELVEQHGGEIGVESHPGAGSTFWFTLPLT
jgi:signal transduction histidine kinase